MPLCRSACPVLINRMDFTIRYSFGSTRCNTIVFLIVKSSLCQTHGYNSAGKPATRKQDQWASVFHLEKAFLSVCFFVFQCTVWRACKVVSRVQWYTNTTPPRVRCLFLFPFLFLSAAYTNPSKRETKIKICPKGGRDILLSYRSVYLRTPCFEMGAFMLLTHPSLLLRGFRFLIAIPNGF